MIRLKNLIVEGRYDSLVTTLSNKLLGIIKDSYENVDDYTGKFSGQKIYFKQSETIPNIDNDEEFKHIYFEEVENAEIPLEFYLSLKVMWVEGLDDFKYGGDAYNATTRNSAEPPLIEIRFELDPADYPKLLSNVAMHLRDTLRHEIEHTTQSGWNTIASKYINSDQALRTKIETGKLPPARYFTLPKEIDAMIQGLYFKAKKSKQPFAQVVDNYLSGWVNTGTITEKDKEQILAIWRTRLPKLAIRQEL